MKTKPLIFLLALTFLFLFYDSSALFADDWKDGADAYEREDYKTAYKLFLPLAEQGNVDAQFHLGVMYDGGHGAPQDYKEAVKWYRLAAEQGHAGAQFDLGVRYAKGQGVPQGYNEAVKWLLKSAQQKNIKAQWLIRSRYQQQHKQAAEQGDSYAQRFLGASFYLGLGVTQDYAKAAKWYKKAAEQGDSGAQNILGAMYERGKGIPKDYVEAYKWFSVSGGSGKGYGHMYREKIGKRKMTPDQIAEAQGLAKEWIEKNK